MDNSCDVDEKWDDDRDLDLDDGGGFLEEGERNDGVEEDTGGDVTFAEGPSAAVKW